MKWLKRTLIFSVASGLLGCGVKGDPVAPEKPTALGRGRPTYRRAAEKIRMEGLTPERRNREEEEQDDDSK